MALLETRKNDEDFKPSLAHYILAIHDVDNHNKVCLTIDNEGNVIIHDQAGLTKWAQNHYLAVKEQLAKDVAAGSISDV